MIGNNFNAEVLKIVSDRFNKAIALTLLSTASLAGCKLDALPESDDFTIGLVGDLCDQVGAAEPLTDTTDLTPIPADRTPDESREFIGRTVLDRDGKLTLQLAPLPDDTRDAIIASFDPFVACGIGYNGLDTRIWLSNSAGGAQYGFGTNILSLEMSALAGDAAGERALRDGAAVRVAMTHETFHSHHDSWLSHASSDPEVHSGLEALNGYFTAEYNEATELFRSQRSGAIVDAIYKMADDAQSRGEDKQADALRGVISAFSTNGGLHGFAVACDDRIHRNSKCEGRNLEGMVAGIIWDNTGSLDTRLGDVVKNGLKGLQREFDKHLNNWFNVIDESNVLGEAIDNERIGHPKDSVGEWLASLLTCGRYNTPGLAASIGSLPQYRQDRYIGAMRALTSIANTASPEVVRAVPFMAEA